MNIIDSKNFLLYFLKGTVLKVCFKAILFYNSFYSNVSAYGDGIYGHSWGRQGERGFKNDSIIISVFSYIVLNNKVSNIIVILKQKIKGQEIKATNPSLNS